MKNYSPISELLMRNYKTSLPPPPPAAAAAAAAPPPPPPPSSSSVAEKTNKLFSLQNWLKILMKDEDEHSKPSLKHRSLFDVQRLLSSPLGFSALTPSNTPLVRKARDGLVCEWPERTDQQQTKLGDQSLLLENVGDRSVMRNQEGNDSGKKLKDNDSSVKCIHSTISNREEEGGGAKDGEILGELRKEVSMISLKPTRMCAFGGKHTRFFYNSNDEIEEEKEELGEEGDEENNEDYGGDSEDEYWNYSDEDDNPGDDEYFPEVSVGKGELVLKLHKGLTEESFEEKIPEWGKHIRFLYNSDDEIEVEEDVAGSNALCS